MDEEHAELLFGLGRAQVATLAPHQGAEIVPNLRRAFNYYSEVGDVAKAVAAAVAHFPTRHGQVSPATELIPRALELVPADSAEAGLLLTRHIMVLGMVQNDHEGAMRAYQQALEIAERRSDLALKMGVLGSGAALNAYQGRYVRGAKLGNQAVDLSREVDNPTALTTAHMFAGISLFFLGDFSEARPHLNTASELAERLPDRFNMARALGLLSLTYTPEGDLLRTKELSDRALTLVPQELSALGSRALVGLATGNFRDAEPYIGRMLELIPHIPPARAFIPLVMTWQAYMSGGLERLGVAKEAAYSALSSPSGAYMDLISRAALSLIAIMEHDPEAASEQYTAFRKQPFREMKFVAGLYFRDHYLALLAQAMGKIDNAVNHFDDALTFEQEKGMKLSVAWTCFSYAEVLIDRDGQGDEEKAVSLLDESLRISQELSLNPLIERATALRESLNV